ncbi:MAG TPA: rRNA maturation RNase YbeY [Candidatus Woesebacteria bacterium]|nr:rRNA maturation RNase YbeY [Candidatus Woesebacteria bacterium]
MTNKDGILIRHNKNWGLSESLVKKIAKKVLRERGFGDEVELSIYFVGRKKAKELNKNYRRMDYIPQVLGFPMSTTPGVDDKVRLGDIVICTQKLKYEVEFQKSSVERVMEDWLRHGLDNLLKKD